MPKKTQSFNDGMVKIYFVSNIAADGAMPVEVLIPKRELRYHERTVGLTRFYTAKQANVEVKYVLRCPLLRNVSAQDVAIPNDGKQYRIVQVQYPEELTVMDITLEELTQEYDIYQPELVGERFEAQILNELYVQTEEGGAYES